MNSLNGPRALYLLLAVWVALSCYQIYFISIAGSMVPLTTIMMAVVFIFTSWNHFRDRLFLLYVGLFLVTLVCGAWSSVMGLWLYQLVFGFVFIVAYCAAKQLRKAERILALLRIFIWSCLINAILVIVFRFLPSIKGIFISALLGVFRNPDRLTADIPLNIFDPTKSGGVFDNANTAATLHLICLGLAAFCRHDFKWRGSFWLIILLNVTAVIASGSKSAMIIMVTSFIISTGIKFYAKGKRDKFARLLIVGGVAIFLASATAFVVEDLFSSDFGHATADTSEDRINLLVFAGDLFWDSPFKGLGFGGWQEMIARSGLSYGVLPNWPPHNSFVEAWATTGIPGVVITFIIILNLFFRTWEFSRSSPQRGSGLFFVLLCAVIMPFGDPQPFLGPPQAAPALGIAFAYCYLAKRGNVRRLH